MAETIIDEVVRLEGVCRHYSVGEETVKALDDVSFTISKGGYWAIMGPSGSGKSTLLNILGCLDRPTAGAYWLNGENTATMEDNALSDHRLFSRAVSARRRTSRFSFSFSASSKASRRLLFSHQEEKLPACTSIVFLFRTST